MGFYRSYCVADTWITNISPTNLATARATGSNHGSSPSLDVFARKGYIISGSTEVARSLMKFDFAELSGKIYNDRLIPSGSISYILKLGNMSHDDTVPSSYDLFVYPLSRSWDEGNGLDDVKYQDLGYASWLSASSTAAWTTTGSDYYTTGYGSGSQHFDRGQEDMEVDITSIVNAWMTGGLPNYGLVLKLGNAEESNGVDYFNKKFHSRESKYVEKIPYIEARWSEVLKDNRKNFAFDVENKLIIYNFIRGELMSFSQPVTLRIQDHLIGTSASFSQSYTTYQTSTGILTASVLIENTASFAFSSSFYDIWTSGSKVYYSGSFIPLVLTASDVDQYDQFDIDVTNLQRVYDSSEEARIKVFARKRDFKTHRGSIKSGSLDIEKEYIEKMYYSVINEDTGQVVVPFGTGSTPYTQLSYDANGNFFNLWMNNFVPGFVYRLKFLIDINRYDKKIIDNDYIFKVV